MPKETRPPESTSKSNRMVNKLKPGQTPAAGLAEMMVGGLATNAVTAAGFSKMFGELDVSECVTALVTAAQRVKDGDLDGLEATLTAQVVTLNAIFTQLAHQTSKMTIVDQIDRFTRLALKAQGQCRATIETLALIKNPPTVFARQANIAHGPQQVNNRMAETSPTTQTPSRAENLETQPIKLLEAQGERMDFGTPGTSGRGDQALAPVGALDRPAKR